MRDRIIRFDERDGGSVIVPEDGLGMVRRGDKLHIQKGDGLLEEIGDVAAVASADAMPLIRLDPLTLPQST